MPNTPEIIPTWTSHDIEMLNHVEVFLHKPAIMKKGEHFLNALGEGMIQELAHSKIAFPPGTKLTKTQLARGENNQGFPFISLDIPQMFSKSEMLTYRTLFWWGHYLGFSLILKGPQLPRYTKQLIANKNNLAGSNVYLATTTTPWEWSLDEQNFKKLDDLLDEEVQHLIETIEHIKIIRVFPMSEPSFISLNWMEAGISAWRDLSSIAEE
jgi:hypothetical protein